MTNRGQPQSASRCELFSVCNRVHGQHAAVALLALLAGGFLSSACSSSASSESRSVGNAAGVASVVRGSLDVGLSLSGELEASVSENIAVPATGAWQLTVEWVVEDGALVKKGDRVVEFDSSAFSAEIEQKRMAVKQAERALDALRAQNQLTVADKKQIIDVAVLEVEKAKVHSAVSRDLISERDWQERQLALETRTAALADARADAASSKRAAELDLKVQKIALNAAEKGLTASNEKIAALTLVAPRDGLALLASHPWDRKRKLVAGETVRVGWTVVRLPQLSELLVRARLSDVDDGQVVPGLSATVVFDAFPESPQKGIVSSVSPVARSAQFGSERRSFDVDVALLDGTLDWMRPGMSARVDVKAASAGEVLLVPRAAIEFSTVASSAVGSHRDAPDKSHDKTHNKAADNSPDKTQNKTPDKTQNNSPDKTQNKTPDKTQNKALDKAHSKVADKTNENAPDSPVLAPDADPDAKAVLAKNDMGADEATVNLGGTVVTASRERATVKRSGGGRVEVDIGMCNQLNCEVRAGLAEGDQVVVRGNK